MPPTRSIPRFRSVPRGGRPWHRVVLRDGAHPGSAAQFLPHAGEFDLSAPPGGYDVSLLFTNAASMSMGTGKTMVEFFSAATSVSVCRNRSWSEVGF